MADCNKLLFCVTIILLHVCVYCWIPRIINGRPKGGKLRAPKLPTGVKTPPAMWFDTQRLDHFDGSNYDVWSQRYFVNDTFYKPGGPIFVMIGGEGPANPIWMVEGQWVTYYAPMHNAICVSLEHRYYGESHPVKNLSTANLRYLSSKNALEDLAYFLDFFRAKYNLKDNKLITFGGSYPGSLSAWFRSKYPYMVDGAVATSAPIYAQVDFKEYLQVVVASLATTGNTCNVNIGKATQTMAQWWGQPDKREMLYDMFKLCDKIDPDNVLDKAGFFENLAGNFEDVVQYNKDNRAFEGAIGTNITIDTLCHIMNDFTLGSPIKRYAYVNSLILKTYNQTCLDYKYSKMVDDMKKISWEDDAAEGGRQWTFQTCAEFGWFQSSGSKQPFGDPLSFPVNYSFHQCMDIFEKEFDGVFISENVAQTNRHYGGRSIPITNVVFPNGAIDPWHAMGVTEDISPTAKAIFMKETAHCANMYPSTPDDPEDLVAARQEIAKLIGTWIS